MIEKPANPPSGSFEERVDILIGELELAIKWERPSVLLAVYGSEYVRADAISAIENYLIEHGQKIAHLRWAGGDGGVIAFLRKQEDPKNTIFFVDGLKWESDEHTAGYHALNLHKEVFSEQKIHIIFWLTQNESLRLAHNAPDFWACRHRVVEFLDSPKPEQVLQTALESAWQGTGEYTDQFEDTDAKISLREAFLTELPENTESTSMRANLMLTLAILNWRKGDYERADSLLREALRISDKIRDNWFEAECFNALALVKSGMGRNDDAIEAYKQAIRLAPDQIFAWNNLGSLCLKIHRNDEAMIAFQKTIEHNPRDPVAWNGLGDVYYKSGYVDDAIASYRKAIEFAPTLAHPWTGLGDVYASVGRLEEAVTTYQKAIYLNRNFITPWLRLANLYSRQDRNRDAIKAYQRALSIDPKNSPVWNDLGLTYLKSAAYEDAVEAFAKSIDLDRSFGWAYSNLALAYAYQGKYKESVSLYLRSIELFTEDEDKAISWNRLGNAYRSLNDYDNAIAAYQMADMVCLKNPSFDRLAASGGLEADLEIDERPAVEVQTSMDRQSAVKAPVRLTPVELNLDLEQEADDDAPAWLFQAAAPSEEYKRTASEKQAVVDSESIPDDEIVMPEPERPGPLLHEQDGFEDDLETSAPAEPIPGQPQPETQRQTRTSLREKVHIDDFFEHEEIKADSTNAFVWNEKGNVHFQTGAYEAAVDAYNKAIELDHAFGWPYCNLALTYLTLGKYAEASLLYQKSVDLLATDKDKAVAWNGLGNLYRCLGDYDNAVAAYQKADELDPETAGVREQVEYFHAEPDGKSVQVWNELGDLFFKAADYNEAARAYEKAIKMDAANGWNYSSLALTLVFQGRYKDAIPLYLRSIDLLKDDKEKAVSWNRLGNVYRRLNDYDSAIEAYQNAVKLNDEKMTLLTRTRFSLLGNCYID